MKEQKRIAKTGSKRKTVCTFIEAMVSLKPQKAPL